MSSRSRSGGIREQQSMPDEKRSPFVIKCISEECTVVFAGMHKFFAGQLDDEIAKGANIPGSFGYKLKQARDEVANL